LVGFWALLAPRSFYDDFPGGGRSWVSALPPYNEHLVRDVGGLPSNLAVVDLVRDGDRAVAVVANGGAGWDHSALVKALELMANHEIGGGQTAGQLAC